MGKVEDRSVHTYKRYTDFSIDMYTRTEEQQHQLLRGRALLSPEKGEMAFVENTPRGARSKEVMRTPHARMVRRPDGLYTVTFACLEAGELNLREQMLAEVRKLVTFMGEDKKVEVQKKSAQKQEEKKEGGEG